MPRKGRPHTSRARKSILHSASQASDGHRELVIQQCAQTSEQATTGAKLSMPGAASHSSKFHAMSMREPSGATRFTWDTRTDWLSMRLISVVELVIIRLQQLRKCSGGSEGSRCRCRSLSLRSTEALMLSSFCASSALLCCKRAMLLSCACITDFTIEKLWL